MIQYGITETIFAELSLFSILLLLFLLYNNIALYKISIKDKLSIVLVTTIVLSIFEWIWHYVDGNANFRVLSYICADVYSVCLMIAVSMFTLFSLERFELNFNPKKLNALFLVTPTILSLLLCLTTPWTGLVYSVDEGGSIQYKELFDFFLVPVYFLYMLFSILLAIYYVIMHRKKKKEKVVYARNLLIFAVLTVCVQAFQTYIFRNDGNYLITSLSWAIGFVFFTTYVNTDRFVKGREKIAAVESDLAVATNIQLGALPAVKNALPTHPEVCVSASMTTAKEVGGDFYDFFEIDDSHICFVIADVSGKGVPAALFMMVVKTMIRDHAYMKLSTAEIFTWIGILDTKTKIMKCTNAGHNAVCFAKKDGKFEFLRQRHGVFLAGFDTTQYKEAEIQLESGDCLFLYTDGLTEAHNASSELYGEKRLLDKLNSIKTRGGEGFLKQIADDVNAFAKGTDPFDDLTMMVLKVD